MSKDKSTISPPGGTAARRRLIRGAFSAPVALTLYSGSASAAASLTCVARRSVAPQLPAPADASDTWLRVQAYQLGDSHWVKVSDVVGLAGGNGSLVSYTPGGDWVCVISGNGQSVGTVSNNPQVSGFSLTQSTGKWVAVRFDSGGHIIGVVDMSGAASSGTALTASCWTSFRTTTPP